ncbi:MAG: hypothetical protein AAF483_25635 [Planctomycetota bacterium]
MPKTKRDLLRAFHEGMLGVHMGKLKFAELEQSPLFACFSSEYLETELSDQEFQRQLDQMKKELPEFKAWLLRADLPDLPPLSPRN